MYTWAPDTHMPDVLLPGALELMNIAQLLENMVFASWFKVCFTRSSGFDNVCYVS